MTIEGQTEKKKFKTVYKKLYLISNDCHSIKYDLMLL